MSEPTVLARMKAMARAECRAMRQSWGKGEAPLEPEKQKGPPGLIRERIVPYIGSGLTQAEVAQRLGCTRGPIVRALKELGASLK